jgi:SAM-dependent methyltransferase
MSGFEESWLSLREPADRQARDAGLLDRVAAHFAGRDRVTVTDLGCGTGSTLRVLSPRLPGMQLWHLVDDDTALLAAAVASAEGLGTPGTVTAVPLVSDLRQEVEAVVALETDLLAASAFLDLVSAPWLDRFVGAAARRRRPVYAALSYDGRTECDPPDPLDAAVLVAFNAHQLGDKGLGGALGPGAAAAARRAFEAAGFAVTCADADWCLAAPESALQTRLLLGWYRAVTETGLIEQAALDGWLSRRQAAITDGASRLRVGHQDLWAVPRGAGR